MMSGDHIRGREFMLHQFICGSIYKIYRSKSHVPRQDTDRLQSNLTLQDFYRFLCDQFFSRLSGRRKVNSPFKDN